MQPIVEENRTNDPRVITLGDVARYATFTADASGKFAASGIKYPRVCADHVYCAGDIHVYGAFKTPLRLDYGFAFGNGTEASPSIAFTDDPPTGIYRPGAGEIGLSCGGTGSVVIRAGGEITTPTGNLVLNPAGPAIDLRNKILLNVGGVTVQIGGPNQVIINDPVGNMTAESQLAPLRGGTGIDTSAATGIAAVAGGTWSVRQITDGDVGALGALSVQSLTCRTITPEAGTMTFAARTEVHYTPDAGVGGDVYRISTGIVTTDGNYAALYTMHTAQGSTYMATVKILGADHTVGQSSVYFQYTVRFKNVAGVVTAGGLVDSAKSGDAGLGPTDADIHVVGEDVLFRVRGIAGKTFRWTGTIEFISQIM